MTNRFGTARRPAHSGTAKPAVMLAAVIITLLALPAAALAQDEPSLPCHPIAGWLASQMGEEDWSCEAVMRLHAEGNGYGQIAKAWYLSQYLLADYDGDWTDLLELRQDGNGWGELAHAVRLADALADLDDAPDPEDLLVLREGQELGWGQLRHAAALAAAYPEVLSFIDDAGALAGADGWGGVRKALELEPGPPPWAGKSKIKQPKPGKAARHSGNE